MTNISDMVKDFQKQLQSRIGTSLMKPIAATIGNPTDDSVFASGTNRSADTEVYIHLLTSEDPTSYTTALRGAFTRADIYYGRPVTVVTNDAGDYVLYDVDSTRDAEYSVGLDQQDNQKPVYLKQVMEIGTLHPIAGSLKFRVTSGIFGNDYYSGADSADFSTGTVQDTTPANITIPTTNGQAKGILVQLDATTGTLEYKQSSEFSAILSLAQAYKAGLLPLPDDDKYRLGYLKLVKGITVFTYDHIWEAPELLSKGSTPLLDNLTATAAPTANDDSGDGYSVGSSWFDVTNNKIYLCIDATLTAAIWQLVGTGDVVGPGSSTDNTVARWDGATGKLLQNSPNTKIFDNGGMDITLAADASALYIVQAAGQTSVVVEIDDSDFNPQILFDADGKATFNEEGNAVDFRIEGDTNANLFFVDGSADNIGIGTNAPDASAQLEVVGQVFVNGDTDQIQLRVQGNGTQTAMLATFENSAGTVKASIDNDGDIVANSLDLTVALPIADGGTGQTTQTAAMDALAPTTTKGDIIVHNGTDNIRLPVGTDTHVLTADSAETSGLKWVAPSSGGTSEVSYMSYANGSDYSSTSGTYVDVDGTNVKLDHTASVTGDVIVVFMFGARKATGGTGSFEIIQDGTTSSATITRSQAALTANSLTVVAAKFTQTAGTSTYKLRYKTSDANAVFVITGLTIQAFAYGVA